MQLSNHDTTEINPNNKQQIKDLKTEKLCLVQLMNYMISILNICKTQNGERKKAQENRIKVENVSENWPIDLHLDKDDFMPMLALEDDNQANVQPNRI